MTGQAGHQLTARFFDRSPQRVAIDLIGCTLLRHGVGGMIVETEAYERDDPACHAFSGMTDRNSPLFGQPGKTYVYLCYGIHTMFNLVADSEGVAAAVLVRALEPTHGLARMGERRGRTAGDARALCSGPGKLCEALSIALDESGRSAVEAPYELAGRPESAGAPEVVSGRRIGISRGTELPWRYCLAGSHFLSRPAG